MVIGIPKKVLKIIIFRFIFFLKIIDKKKKIKYNSQAVKVWEKLIKKIIKNYLTKERKRNIISELSFKGDRWTMKIG